MKPKRWENSKLIFILLLFIIASVILVGCKMPEKQAFPAQATPTASAAPEAPSSTIAVITPTSNPNLVILLASEGVDPVLEAAIQTTLSELATETGLRFETYKEISELKQRNEVRVMVILPPDPGVVNLSTANPDIQFLAIGIEDLSPSHNLSLIGDQFARADQQGFLGGYLAAVITADWRVGVISRSDTLAGKAARNGFSNGVIFFCGLCRPAFPPFIQYPILTELTGSANEAEKQAAINMMTTNAVNTIYLSPGIDDTFFLEALSAAGIKVIASADLSVSENSQLVATIKSDQTAAIRQLWEALLAGQGGVQVEPPITLANVNPALLSPGRLRLVESMLSELTGGFISTGIDPKTGEAEN